MKAKSTLRKVASRVIFRHRIRQFPFSAKERQHNFIFIHIPKSGGTAIRAALGYRMTGRQHLPWYVYYAADPIFYNKAFKFAVVRNPWDRAVSAYHYLAQGGNGTSDTKICNEIRKYKNFKDFIVNGLAKGSFRSNLLFLPQSNFLVDGIGDLKVDFIGRLESLNSDFQEISKNLRFNTKEIHRSNMSSRSSDYRRYYKSTEVSEIVAEVYRQDIKLFGYSFGENGN